MCSSTRDLRRFHQNEYEKYTGGYIPSRTFIVDPIFAQFIHKVFHKQGGNPKAPSLENTNEYALSAKKRDSQPYDINVFLHKYKNDLLFFNAIFDQIWYKLRPQDISTECLRSPSSHNPLII